MARAKNQNANPVRRVMAEEARTWAWIALIIAAYAAIKYLI